MKSIAKLFCFPLLFFLLFSCSKTNISGFERIQKDPDFKNLISKINSYNLSFLNDEWNLSNGEIKKEWNAAKKNGTFSEFSKTLKNKEGVTLYEKNKELLAINTQVYYKLVIKEKVPKDLLNNAILNALKEISQKNDYTKLNYPKSGLGSKQSN